MILARRPHLDNDAAFDAHVQYARTADGVSIACWTLGDGAPLVYLAGGPWSHIELWQVAECRRWYARLARHRMLVRSNVRGTGLSERNVADYSLDALVLDGVMIGTGSTIRPGLGLLLALGQPPADVPEGFATIANLKERGLGRGTRLLLSGAFALPILLGTTVGFWAVRGQPEIVKLALLAFTAGILSTVVIEEMVTEAHRAQEDTPWMAVAFVGGFAHFALISTYLG